MRQLQQKYSSKLFRSTQVVGMVLGIGGMVFLGAVCTQTATNINTSNAETNSPLSNIKENTNSSEIDTSDWLTYKAKQYGFSFKFPKTWGSVVSTKDGAFPEVLTFENNSFPKGVPGNPRIVVSDRTEIIKEGTDGMLWFDFSKVDFNKSENENASLLKRNSSVSLQLQKIEIQKKLGFQAVESLRELDGSISSQIHFFIPEFYQSYDLTISGDQSIRTEIEELVHSLEF